MFCVLLFFALGICYGDVRNRGCWAVPFRWSFITPCSWVSYNEWLYPNHFAVSLQLSLAPEPELSWWQWADAPNQGCSWSLLVVSSLHQSLWELKDIQIFLEIEPFSRPLVRICLPAFKKRKYRRLYCGTFHLFAMPQNFLLFWSCCNLTRVCCVKRQKPVNLWNSLLYSDNSMKLQVQVHTCLLELMFFWSVL